LLLKFWNLIPPLRTADCCLSISTHDNCVKFRGGWKHVRKFLIANIRRVMNVVLFYSFFLVIMRLLNFMYRRFGTLYSIFISGVSRKNSPCLHSL
jgi:hypothetical protein